MIEEEILSEILGVKVTLIRQSQWEENAISWSGRLPNGFIDGDINIYELAHMCKEWCLKQDVWNFKISHHGKNTEIQHLIGKVVVSISEEGNDFTADTEPEAIFKATEWVYERIKDKEG